MNSERFLSAFHKTEEHLRKLSSRTDKSAFTFAAVVHEAPARRPEVRQFKDDLLELAELRNAIAQQRTKAEYVIPEPNDTIVVCIERIYEVVSNPVKVLPTF